MREELLLLNQVENLLGISFRNKKFLDQALTHRSYPNENPEWQLGDNERLEFVGDSILEFVVRSYLFRNFPWASEGALANLKSALVNNRMIAQVAEEIGLEGKFIKMSCGQREDFERGEFKTRILATVFEAIIGAIYFDRSTQAAELFINEHLLPKLTTIQEKKLYLHPKGYLQEITQELLHLTPTYRILRQDQEEGVYVMGVFLGDRLVGQGQDQSRARASEEAAREALEKEFKISLPRR